MVSNMKKPKFSVVSFLDILGYKEIIKDSERVDELFVAVLSAINTTYKDVEGFVQKDQDNRDARGRDSIIQTLKYRAFSDNIVVSCELYPEPKDRFEYWENAVAIGTVLMIQADIQAELLIRHGFLSRGGTTIGDYYVDDEFVFGKALVDAFELEQNAIYPRILVDEKTRSLFIESAQEANYNARVEDRGTFQMDYDGEYFVDYLRVRAHLWKILFGQEFGPNYENLLLEHGRAIDGALVKNGQSIEKSRKLRQKYAWVRGYQEYLMREYHPRHNDN